MSHIFQHHCATNIGFYAQITNFHNLQITGITPSSQYQSLCRQTSQFLMSSLFLQSLLPLEHRSNTLVGAIETLVPLVGNKKLLLKPMGYENKEHVQETKIYVENYFFLKRKTTGPTLNNFTIIKSITIFLKFMPNLKFPRNNNNILSRN